MRTLSLSLFIFALIAMQALIGGARQVFGLPTYIVLALSGLALATVRREQVGVSASCVILIGVLAAWIVGRAIGSPVNYLARHDFFMVIAALVAYLSFAYYFTDEKSRLVVFGVLIAGAIAHATVGAIQFKENNDFMLLPGIMRPSYQWRASGFYICPNHLAGLLEMLSLMGISLVFWGKMKRWLRVLLGYGVLMCLLGLALTGSRGGYLSVVFGMGIFSVISLWITHRLRTGRFWFTLGSLLCAGVLLIGGTLFVMLKSDTLAVRLGQIYEPKNMRLYMWRAALEQFRLDPIVGTGSGTYLYYGRQFRDPSVQNDPIHVHNDYLELLAEYGLIGAALCAAAVLMHLVAGCAGLRRIVDEKLAPYRETNGNGLALLVGILSAVGALLAHSVVDFNLHIPANTVFVGMLFGILAAPMSGIRRTSNIDSQPSAWPWTRWAIPSVSMVFLLLSFRLLPGEVYAEKARVALRDNRFSESLEAARNGLKWDRWNPNLFAYAGEAQHFLTMDAPNAAFRRELHLRAVDAYNDALRIFPRDTGLLLKLAQTLDLLGQYAEAEEIYQRAFDGDPNFGNVYAYYGRHLQMQRRFKAAERYYAKALEGFDWPVAKDGKESIRRMKENPVSGTLMSLSSEPDDPSPVMPRVLNP